MSAWHEGVSHICRECGCTPAKACHHPDRGTCCLVEPGLCSACLPDADKGWRPPEEASEVVCICTDADDPNDHRKDCPMWEGK